MFPSERKERIRAPQGDAGRPNEPDAVLENTERRLGEESHVELNARKLAVTPHRCGINDARGIGARGKRARSREEPVRYERQRSENADEDDDENGIAHGRGVSDGSTSSRGRRNSSAAVSLNRRTRNR